jgi:hypothetical protein
LQARPYQTVFRELDEPAWTECPPYQTVFWATGPLASSTVSNGFFGDTEAPAQTEQPRIKRLFWATGRLASSTVSNGFSKASCASADRTATVSNGVLGQSSVWGVDRIKRFFGIPEMPARTERPPYQTVFWGAGRFPRSTVSNGLFVIRNRFRLREIMGASLCAEIPNVAGPSTLA